jgi:DNA processing protein
MAFSPLQTALFWSSLQVLTKERYEAILRVFSSLEEARPHVSEEFLRGLGCRKDETVRRILMQAEDFDPVRAETAYRQSGARLLMVGDAEYPRMLAEIGDPPVFLYVKGDLSILDQPCIGLVGTRQITPYGRRVTQDFTADFVRAGMTTVSGLAQGVDAEVAEETLRAGGKTVAVLGHGLGMIYPPENAKLAERIVKGGGLLVSEFATSAQPGLHTFPARNRIIAGLSLGTVVLEAPEKSGALITADLALEYSREVFAVPGQIYDTHYAGCHALLAKGHAHIALHAAGVLRELGMVVPDGVTTESAYEPQTPEEATLYPLLTGLPQPTDDLVERSGLPPGTVSATLTMLELSGAARNMGGGQWVRA